MAVKSSFRKAVKQCVTPVYEYIPLWCFPKHQLQFKAYGMGIAKTGTTSLHVMFKQNYRSAHEAEVQYLFPKMIAFAHSKMAKTKFAEYIKHRDKRLSLEMDSSGLNCFLVDILVEEFKEAKFILTIRDCYSWLDSIINHQLLHPLNEVETYWQEGRNFVYRPQQFNYEKEEQLLADKGLYPLDSYLSRYRRDNNRVLNTVPTDRLLIVRTHEINQSVAKIEQFLNIPSGSLPTQVRAHVRKTQDKHHILSQIDRDFLTAKVDFHCRELMDNYFPEFKNIKH